MRKNFILISHVFKSTAKPLFIVAAAMMVVEFMCMLVAALFVQSTSFLPYERIFEMSGAPYFFAAAFVAALFLMGKSMADHFGRSKGIYTLLSLPQKRTSIYYSHVLAGMLSLAVIVTAQLLVVVLAYLPIMGIAGNNAPQYSGIQGFDELFPYYAPFMNNGLFLAFARSKLLRMLMPLHVAEYFWGACLLLMMCCVLHNLILCRNLIPLAGLHKKIIDCILCAVAFVLAIFCIIPKLLPQNGALYSDIRNILSLWWVQALGFLVISAIARGVAKSTLDEIDPVKKEVIL
ncbi:MAG: hypothetical protein ACOYJC_06955 [Christensenellales bacterium]|jgi:hypothetical protein